MAADAGSSGSASQCADPAGWRAIIVALNDLTVVPNTAWGLWAEHCQICPRHKIMTMHALSLTFVKEDARNPEVYDDDAGDKSEGDEEYLC